MKAPLTKEERRLRALESDYSQLGWEYESLTSEQESLQKRVAYFRKELAMSTNTAANFELEERIRRDERRLSELDSRLVTIRADLERLDEERDTLSKEIADSKSAETPTPDLSPTVEEPSAEYKRRLRKQMDSYFSLSELRTICFDLGIDYEELPGGTKQNFTVGLIEYVIRRNRLPELLDALRRERPKVNWY